MRSFKKIISKLLVVVLLSGLFTGFEASKEIEAVENTYRKATKIWANERNSFYLDDKGVLHSTGDYNYGQLGNGTSNDSSTFQEVVYNGTPTGTVKDLATSLRSTVILMDSGEVWYAGDQNTYRLGGATEIAASITSGSEVRMFHKYELLDFEGNAMGTIVDIHTNE